ncbi:transglycosylase domain-containing protein [bacterium]|nr:transglycosylase domain-containing protein [bacterium]
MKLKIRKRTLIFVLSPFVLGFLFALFGLIFIDIIKFPIDLSQYQPRELTKIYDINGEEISTLYAERREVASLDEMPEFAVNATIAIEDPYFYHHKGIRLKAILRAFVHNLKTLSVSQGGSTISQQLAKNMTNNMEKRLVRKIKEAFFTLKIEKTYTKDQIVELYINQINYGYGNYGVALASRAYFDKLPIELTIAEAALIAGLPQRPTYFYPHRHLERALKRQKTVLSRMFKYGFITEDEYTIAKKEKIILKKQEKKKRFAPYFIDHLIKELVVKYGYAATFNGGLKVYTTLRKDIQESLETTMEGSRYQGGLLTLDPKTGGILGMVGGRDYEESKFNRTTQAPRQCGSAFKVFLYTTYIKYRIGTLADLWYDTPIHFPQLEGTRLPAKKLEIEKEETEGDEELEEEEDEDEDDTNTTEEDIYKLIGWVPRNYSRFHGPTIVYDAIRQSINIVALKVLLSIGVKDVIETAHEMGIKSYLKPIVSLPLGANEVKMLELAAAFAPLANGGYKIEPYCIVRVEDQIGKVLEWNTPQKKKVLDAQTVYIMDWVLKKVVDSGSGTRAKIWGYPVAGKTGTTNNFTDAWFVGFTPNYVTAVFLGNDDPSDTLGNKRAGGAVAAPLWKKAMKPILTKEVPVDFKMPSGIKFLRIDRSTGKLAGKSSRRTAKLPFIEGTEVTATSKDVSDKEDLLMKRLKSVEWIK